MKFRPHRGGLAEAMAEMVELDGMGGLRGHLSSGAVYGEVFDATKILVKPYGGDDARIGWRDVHIVIVEGWGPVGFTEGMPK